MDTESQFFLSMLNPGLLLQRGSCSSLPAVVFQKLSTVCKETMDVEIQDAPTTSLVKASLRLGSEVFTIAAKNDTTLSAQLVSMKEESMSVLKEYIVKHNVPIDVPDELVEEESSEDEAEAIDVKAKKTKVV